MIGINRDKYLNKEKQDTTKSIIFTHRITYTSSNKEVN